MHTPLSVLDPKNLEKEAGSGKQAGVEVYTAECQEFYLLLNLPQPVELSAEPDTHTSVLIFPLGVQYIYKYEDVNVYVLVSLHLMMALYCYFKLAEKFFLEGKWDFYDNLDQ